MFCFIQGIENYKEKVLTAINPINPINTGINTQLNANMPQPAVQNGTKEAVSAPKTEVINDSFSYTEAPLNVGVLEGPANYSKTPIADEIQRRADSTPREILPNKQPEKVSKKKSKTKTDNEPLPAYSSKKHMTAGNLSAVLSVGSMAVVALMTIPKAIRKLIKHK